MILSLSKSRLSNIAWQNKSDDALRDLPDNLTGPEKLLVSWAGKMATYLSGSRSDEDVTSVLGIFKSQSPSPLLLSFARPQITIPYVGLPCLMQQS